MAENQTASQFLRTNMESPYAGIALVYVFFASTHVIESVMRAGSAENTAGAVKTNQIWISN